MKNIKWALFIFFAVGIGLYPLSYALVDNVQEFGILSRKSETLKSSQFWWIVFNTHIFVGGLALLTGWSQFSTKIRKKYLNFHRGLGKIYVLAVMISGLSGGYVAYHTEGGWVAQLGFLGLAFAWLYTTAKAYITIRKKEIKAHEKWMIRSYALTFAAVTLRFWLPLFEIGFGMDFISAYVIIAWLCWVPNLLWAEWRIRRLKL